MLNPAQAIWRYMRGDDIREADRRTIAANLAEAAVRTAGAVATPRDTVKPPVPA
jgi:hypothetical protein